MADRVGGIIQFKLNGEIQKAKGSATYGLGIAKREAVMGVDGHHGFKEAPQVGFIEIAITDRGDLDVKAMMNATDVTATCALANGKLISLTNGYYAGDGTASTEEGEIGGRWEGDVEEIAQ